MSAKFCNSVQTIKRTLHDVPSLREDEAIKSAINVLSEGVKKLLTAESIEQIIGIEGNCAQSYFSVFDKLITNKTANIHFEYRNKRPPLDEVNALMSFVYTLYTNEFASALETVGLDSYIGFCHAQRVQNSVFEADLDYSAFLKLKNRLLEIIDDETDSLRFYYLGNNWLRKVEHIGSKKTYNPEGVLII